MSPPLGISLSCAPSVLGQSETRHSTAIFDVASIHRHKSDDGLFSYRDLPDGVSIQGIPLNMLIQRAYGIRETSAISGLPAWASEKFDVEGRVSENEIPSLATLDSGIRNRMLRALLEERFQLRSHSEKVNSLSYEMVMAKGGLKLTPANERDQNDPDGDRIAASRYTTAPGQLNGEFVSMSTLRSLLSIFVGAPVEDKTGLSGHYRFTLKWKANDNASDTDDGASIFTAVQEQLGLKLVPVKGTSEKLIIDHIEKSEQN